LPASSAELHCIQHVNLAGFGLEVNRWPERQQKELQTSEERVGQELAVFPRKIWTRTFMNSRDQILLMGKNYNGTKSV
jgi:hypothetical protein